MRPQRSALRSLTARTLIATFVFAAAAGAGVARASCPPGQEVACVLHEEAVALFTEGKFEQAAVKFRAAIAAAPTARSFLGYSQSIESQGKIALAYETMLEAQKYSNQEVAANGSDPAIIGRAERIKYKLGELRAKVAFVWLQLPTGVPPHRVVSMHREGEGDLHMPIGRWVTVAPERQVLIVTLDDGQRLEVVATVAAGGQNNLVLPIRPAVVQPPAPTTPPPAAPPRPPPPTGRPIAALYQKPPPPPPRPLPPTMLAVGMSFLGANPDNLAMGVGFTAVLDRRLNDKLGLTVRVDALFHPGFTTFTPLGTEERSAEEIVIAAGVRTMGRVAHARAEIGATAYSEEVRIVGTSTSGEGERVLPTLLLGGGLQLGRFRLQTSLMLTPGNNLELGPRVLVTLAGDLLR